MNKRKAGQAIKQFADSNVNAPDRPRFIEVIETELMSLHEGNFARYQVRLPEFQAWKEIWGKSRRGWA